MTRLFARFVAGGLLAGVLLGGCGGGGGGSTPTTVTVRGQVLSDETPAAKLEGARVVLGGKVTHTDADGNFEFKDVAVTSRQSTVTVPLTVSKQGYGTLLDEVVDLPLGGDTTLDPVRLPPLTGTGTVTGKVVRDSDGAALVNVLVSVGVSGAVQKGRTDDTGTFELSGVYTGEQPYRAEKDGYLSATGSVDNVIQGASTALSADIRLVASNAEVTVTGTVKDEDGQPISGATVKVGTRTASTRTDGTYELTQVPVGTQTFTVTKDGYLDSSRPVDVTGQQGPVDFVLFTGDEEGSIPTNPFNLAGTVVDGGGSPLANVTVTASTEGGSQVASFKTDATGKFYLFVPAGTYTLQAEDTAGKHVEQPVTLPSGGQIVTGITLTLS